VVRFGAFWCIGKWLGTDLPERALSVRPLVRAFFPPFFEGAFRERDASKKSKK